MYNTGHMGWNIGYTPSPNKSYLRTSQVLCMPRFPPSDSYTLLNTRDEYRDDLINLHSHLPGHGTKINTLERYNVYAVSKSHPFEIDKHTRQSQLVQAKSRGKNRNFTKEQVYTRTS